ncbi:hypothetical protein C3F09_00835 [candidate division GN15 bacterium]|uniref:Carbohydrate binding family 9 domain-containing protein n=1 Tax=candidate division GN15 bacterium TaxID=2072418 RepID=A0A855X6N4_9BACT|nr:MAG: hypothetical protein C3F09_00835 [candidate division GN15 bacterium]
MYRWLKQGSLVAASLLLLAASPLTQSVSTTDSPVRELKACRVNGHTPQIDGNLSEPGWDTCAVPLARGFTQKVPNEGQPATESTTVAVMYDDDALYIAFWCFDSRPDQIVSQLVRRDRYSEADYVEAAIDPFHDHQSGNEFVVNVSGALQDSRLYNDESSDMTWDGVWEGRARLQPWGYSVEMRIPYHCLRFAEANTQTWGINFYRYVGRRKEESRWSFSPLSQAGFTSRFGHLTGIDNIRPARHLEVLPYGVSSMKSEPSSLRNADGRTYGGNTGVDVKYGISSDLVLDATINPDFGQVELDQPVLNLSAYETFYEEKRPFFQEGADLFSTDYTLFYSRRIGRPPRYALSDPSYGYYDGDFGFETDRPSATTILGAAKLTGKLSDKTTIAVLTATTAQEKAEYAALSGWTPELDTAGDTTDWIARDTTYRKGIVEPVANYSVIRVKQNILRNSFVGGMLTVATQDRVRPATTGGIDWRFVSNDRNWILRGQSVFSSVGTGKTGYGFASLLQRKAGRHVMASISARFNSPDLQLNRLGYNARADAKTFIGWVQYRTTEPWWIVQSSQSNLNIYSRWNYDGVNIMRSGDINNYLEFTNGWSINTSVEVQGEKYSDEETRGNGLWIWPVYPTYSFHMCGNTDPRKNLSFHLGGAYGTDRGGDWWGAHSNLTLKPKSNIELILSSSYTYYGNSTRWISNSMGEPVFGTLNYSTLNLGLSGSVLFNQNLSIQVSAQGLLNGLDYFDYRFYRFADNSYFADPALAGWNTDYNYSALNTMALLRWEYMPGSTLYLVWTRANGVYDPTVNNLDFSRDLKRLLGRGSDNVFLLKLSYWMNM